MSFVLPSNTDLPIAARYKLLGRCHNCFRITSGIVPVPETDDMPQSTDELMDSALLGQIRFKCDDCEGGIFTIVGASFIGTGPDDARASA